MGAAYHWTTRWSPFGKQIDPQTFGRYLGDVEDVCIQPQISGGHGTLEDWLWMTFNIWCFDCMRDNEWDWADAWVSERSEPEEIDGGEHEEDNGEDDEADDGGEEDEEEDEE